MNTIYIPFPSPNTTKEHDTRDKCFSTMSAVFHSFPSKDKLYIEMRTLFKMMKLMFRQVHSNYR